MCEEMRLSKVRMKKLLLLLTLLMIIEIFFYFLRDIMISVSLSLAVRRSDNLSLGTLHSPQHSSLSVLPAE